MKKSAILASAVALASGSAFADMSISGHVAVTVENYTQMDTVNDTATLIFKGNEDLGNGMKAMAYIELDGNAVTKGAAMGNDKTYVGLSGDFGTVLMGRMAAFNSWVCSMTDKFDSLQGGTGDQVCNAVQGEAFDGVIAYTNTFGDISIGVAGVDTGESFDSTQIAVKYAADALTVALASTDVDGAADATLQVGVQYQISDDMVAALTFNDNGTDNGIEGYFGMKVSDNGMVNLGIGSGDVAEANNHDTVRAGYTHSMSKATRVSIEAETAGDTEDDTYIGLTLGHKF